MFDDFNAMLHGTEEQPQSNDDFDGDDERASLDEWKYGKAFTETYIEPDPVDWRFRMM